jgi:hypothetical protein
MAVSLPHACSGEDTFSPDSQLMIQKGNIFTSVKISQSQAEKCLQRRQFKGEILQFQELHKYSRFSSGPLQQR